MLRRSFLRLFGLAAASAAAVSLPATSAAAVPWPFVGTLHRFTGTIPPGWLACDGRAVSRERYKSLFEVLDTEFGEGNGKTTFNLPFCWSSDPLAATNGDAMMHSHTLSMDELPSHTHSIDHRHQGVANGRLFAIYAGIDA